MKNSEFVANYTHLKKLILESLKRSTLCKELLEMNLPAWFIMKEFMRLQNSVQQKYMISYKLNTAKK